jgi:hypothetical protein
MHCEPTDPSTPKPPQPKAAAASPSSLPATWWLALGVLAVVAGLVLWWRWLPARDTPEALVERFARLMQSDRRAALALLGPPAPFDLEPLSEAEAEARASDYFLRLENTHILAVLPGVPDGLGKQRPLPDHWTLVTRANGSTPAQRIRTREGISPPRSMTLTNPDIIVEVRQGKLVPVRMELPLR